MAREQLKASIILGSESTSSRMQSNGRRMLLLNETRTESEVIDRVNATSYEETNELMRELLSAENALALVGKIPATIFNAVVAILFAPILAVAIRKALDKNHLSLN